jgi:putative salt-induced outer membrane protein
MRVPFLLAILSIASSIASPALADTPHLLPPSVREMLEAAIANGSENDIATVAKIARQTNPGSADEIAKMVQSWKDRTKKTREQVIREASFTQLWSGRIEVGGFRSTGSTSELGLSGTVSIKRTGIQWSHELLANADHREANGIVSRDRYLISYQPKYQFDPRGFAYGLLLFERDPAIGYDARYTASSGIGYKLIVSTPLDLQVDIGPSIRHVSYTSGVDETKLGGRGSLDLAWRLAPNLTFKQTASGYAESNVYTFNALSALETKVATNWAARFSYTVQYESESMLTNKAFDTLSRVTLTYDF